MYISEASVHYFPPIGTPFEKWWAWPPFICLFQRWNYLKSLEECISIPNYCNYSYVQIPFLSTWFLCSPSMWVHMKQYHICMALLKKPDHLDPLWLLPWGKIVLPTPSEGSDLGLYFDIYISSTEILTSVGYFLHITGYYIPTPVTGDCQSTSFLKFMKIRIPKEVIRISSPCQHLSKISYG